MPKSTKTTDAIKTVYYAKHDSVYVFEVRETATSWLIDGIWQPTLQKRFKKSEPVPWSDTIAEAVAKHINRVKLRLDVAKEAVAQAESVLNCAAALAHKSAEPAFVPLDRRDSTFNGPDPEKIKQAILATWPDN